MEKRTNCCSCDAPLESHWKFCPICGEVHEKTASGYLKDAEKKTTWDEAIKELDEGLKKFPSDTGLMKKRAFYLELSGNYEDAIRDYTDIIRQDPKNAEAYDNRGSTYYIMKKYDDAIADFSRALEIDPSDVLGVKKMLRKVKNLIKGV